MKRLKEVHDTQAFAGWRVKPRAFIFVLNNNHHGNFGFALRKEELAALKKVGKADKVGRLEPHYLEGDTEHPHYLANQHSRDSDGCLFRFDRKHKKYMSLGINQFLLDSGFTDETGTGSRMDVFPE